MMLVNVNWEGYVIKWFYIERNILEIYIEGLRKTTDICSEIEVGTY